jgi:hypothetical protein
MHEIAFENMGEQQLKNIARPLRVYPARSGVPARVRSRLPAGGARERIVVVSGNGLETHRAIDGLRRPHRGQCVEDHPAIAV